MDADAKQSTAQFDAASHANAGTPKLYHAFISYSHALDGQVATALQLGIQRFAVPWYELRRAPVEAGQARKSRRALRVFRDKTNLSAAPGLWSSIVDGLSASEWFILMASPASACSPWVRREIAWWLEHRRRDRLLIAWTGGTMAWGGNDFDWSKTDAVPPELAGALTEEPLWIDLRPFRPHESQAEQSRGRLATWMARLGLAPTSMVRLGDAIADFVAPIRGLGKDELVGAHVRQRRFATTLALATVVALASFAIWALAERDTALVQRNVALANQLVAESATIQDTQPGLARQYVATAQNLSATPQVRAAVAGSSAIPQELHTKAEALAYSRDGRLVATVYAGSVATADSPAQPAQLTIYDAASLRRIFEREFKDVALGAVAFSPINDVLALGLGQTVELWDVSDPKRPQTRNVLLDHGDIIKSLSFRADGRVLASGSRDGTVGLWTIDLDGSVRWTNKLPIALGPAARVSIQFQPAGTLLSIVVVPLATNVGKLPQRVADAISEVGSSGANLWLWDVADPRRNRFIDTEVGKIDSAAFSSDGRHLVTTGDTIQLWTLDDEGKPTEPLPIPVPSRTVRYSDAAYSGNYFSAIAADGFVRLWDMSQLNNVVLVDSLALPANSYLRTRGLTFSPDGTKLAVCSSDSNAGARGSGAQSGTLRIWNLADARQRRAALALWGHVGSVTRMKTSPDQNLFVSADKKQLRVWGIADVGRPQLRSVLPVDGEVTGLSFSPTGRLVAVTMDNKLRVLDVADPEHPHERGTWYIADRPEACPKDLGVPCEGRMQTMAVAFLDEHTVAVGDLAARVSFFDIAQPSVQTPTSTIQAVVWTLNSLRVDGRSVIVLAGTSGNVEFWDTTDVAKPRRMGEVGSHSYQVQDIAVSASGRAVATASRDGTVRLLSLATHGSRISSKAIITDTGDVNSVAFNPSGTRLATLGRDQSIRVYDIKKLGAPALAAIIPLNNQATHRVVFLRDDVLATGTEYGAVDIWDLDRNAIGPSLCTGSGETISSEQWQRVLPALPYQPPCKPAYPTPATAAPAVANFTPTIGADWLKQALPPAAMLGSEWRGPANFGTAFPTLDNFLQTCPQPGRFLTGHEETKPVQGTSGSYTNMDTDVVLNTVTAALGADTISRATAYLAYLRTIPQQCPTGMFQGKFSTRMALAPSRSLGEDETNLRITVELPGRASPLELENGFVRVGGLIVVFYGVPAQVDRYLPTVVRTAREKLAGAVPGIR